MPETFDRIILGGTVWTPNGPLETDVGIRSGRVAAFGHLRGAKTAETFDAS